MIARDPHSFQPRLISLEDRSVPAPIGSLDPAFGGNGGNIEIELGGVDALNAVVVQPDGKIVAAGTNGKDAVVVRLLANGLLDSTFGMNGQSVIDFDGTETANAVALDASGRILIAGGVASDTSQRGFLARLTTDGVLDTTFRTDGGFVFAIAPGAGAKAGGDNKQAGSDSFTPINGSGAFGLAVDGSGRVLVAGSLNGNMLLTRYTNAGLDDPTFNGGSFRVVSFGAPSEARAVVVQDDGKVVLLGSTTRSGQTEGINKDIVAVRFSADGTAFDAAFGNKSMTVNGVNVSVLAIDLSGTDTLSTVARDPFGRYLLVGTTSNTNSIAVARTDGGFTPDASFGTKGAQPIDFGGNETGNGIYAQADGRIVVIGTTDVGANATGNDLVAVRLLAANGGLDPSFGTSGGSVIQSPTDVKGLAAATSKGGDIIAVGSVDSNAFVSRLVATVGVPSLLLAGGPRDGTVAQYTAANGTYGDGTSFTAFPGAPSPARVAAADVTGDGVADRIVGAGPGVEPRVIVYDGATGLLVANFLAFESRFTGGVYVAAGDFDKDGNADVVVSPDLGGGPRVRVLSGAALAANTETTLADYLAIDDANFRGGVRPGVGDMNGDGVPELVVSAGISGGPRVAVWNGTSLLPGLTPTRAINDFFAFESTLRDGAFVAVGDVTGDGFADLVLAGGPSGGPRVRVVNGLGLLSASGFQTLDQVPDLQFANFFAGDPNTRGGVRVAVKDVDGDKRADLVAGSGEGLPSEVRIYRGTTLAANPSSPTADQTLNPFAASLVSGVYVG